MVNHYRTPELDAGEWTVTLEAGGDGVEVSTDGGDSWADAEFFGPVRGPAAWRRFRYLWAPGPGEHLLVSRATDARGRT